MYDDLARFKEDQQRGGSSNLIVTAGTETGLPRPRQSTDRLRPPTRLIALDRGDRLARTLSALVVPRAESFNRSIDSNRMRSESPKPPRAAQQDWL